MSYLVFKLIAIEFLFVNTYWHIPGSWIDDAHFIVYN